jgi:mono/diheme cytochrome c family protein
MKTVAVIFSFVGAVLLVAYGALTWYDNNFPFGRMWETPGVWPHEEPILIMESGVVPFSGGEAIYRAVPAEQLKSPLDLKDPAIIAKGEIGYRNFCLPCHGPNHDGYGTVGQSFAPLPGDLRGEKVQAYPEGQLFQEISFGEEGQRQPALATTIDPEKRWQIVAYVRSLGPRPR